MYTGGWFMLIYGRRPTECCRAIILQLKKEKKERGVYLTCPRIVWEGHTPHIALVWHIRFSKGKSNSNFLVTNESLAYHRCSTSIYWLDERIWAIWEITDYQNLLKVISSLFHSLIQEIAEVYQLHISFRKRKKEISVSLCFVPAIDNAKVSALEKVKE